MYRIGKSLTAALLAIGIAAAIADRAVAQGSDAPGACYGPGCYGDASGAGGYGWGPGMGGGYGYGPGTMGGYGRGPRGGGPGWGGPGPRGGQLAALDLTEEQAGKIAVIQEQNRSTNWERMGHLRGEQFKLQQMLYADKPDPNAVAEQQKAVDELRRQMLKSRVESRNRIAELLTPEQRGKFRSFGPGWIGPER